MEPGTRIRLLTIAALLSFTSAFAQKLPPPSRTVYKCEVDRKVVYSDSPCLGAQKVDVEPTRGLNKSTGTERAGADVRAEQANEQMAKALQPVFGETAEQRARRHRRARLNPAAQKRCASLDEQVPVAEGKERQSTGAELATTQKQLLNLRREYRDLQC